MHLLPRRLLSRLRARVTPTPDHGAPVEEFIVPTIDEDGLTSTDREILGAALETHERLLMQVRDRPELATVLADVLAINQEVGRDALLDIARRQAVDQRTSTKRHTDTPWTTSTSRI